MPLYEKGTRNVMPHTSQKYGSRRRRRELYDDDDVYAIGRKSKSRQRRCNQSRSKRECSPVMYERVHSRHQGNTRRTSSSSSMQRNTQSQQRRSRVFSHKHKQHARKSRQLNGTRKRDATFRGEHSKATGVALAVRYLLQYLKSNVSATDKNDYLIHFLFEQLCTNQELQIAEEISKLMKYDQFETLYELNMESFKCNIAMECATNTFPVICDYPSENGWNADFLLHTTNDSYILNLLIDDNKNTLLSKIKSEIRQDEVLFRISAIALYLRGYGQAKNKSNRLVIKLTYVTPRCSILDIIKTTNKNYEPTQEFDTYLKKNSPRQHRFMDIANILCKMSERYANFKIVIVCTTYDKGEYTNFEFTPLQKHILDFFCTSTKQHNVCVNVKFTFEMSHDDVMQDEDYNTYIDDKWPLVRRKNDISFAYISTNSYNIDYVFGNQDIK